MELDGYVFHYVTLMALSERGGRAAIYKCLGLQVFSVYFQGISPGSGE